MIKFVTIALFVCMGLTFVSLIAGVTYFLKKNPSSYMSNKMMRVRILLQTISILLFIYLLILKA